MNDAEFVIGFVLRCFAAGIAWGALCIIAAAVVRSMLADTRSPMVREIDAMRQEQERRA
jgi:hypothetical protein